MKKPVHEWTFLNGPSTKGDLVNKRDAVLSLLDVNTHPTYVPAGFFLHFDPAYHAGQAAVEKHLEFFRATGMDFVKIQYERVFPTRPEIQTPEDWAKMPTYGLDFYEPQLRAVEGLVKAAKNDALVIQTLYSPFMCAGHSTSEEILARHINENPAAVQRGMRAITDSLMLFVKECIRLGVDGFYTSTQGGEAGRFAQPGRFDQCIRPYDLELMAEANRACPFNILHICDYRLPYTSLTPFVDYPGQVVNCSLEVNHQPVQAQDVEKLFGGRPFMGGMNRKGALSTGTPAQVRHEAEAVLAASPERFILGADCTMLAGAPWENLRAAIDTAHTWRDR